MALSESLSVCRLSVSACLSVCRSSLTLFALYKDIPALSEVPAAASSGTPAQPAAAAAVDEPQPGDLESTSDCKQVPITEFDLESPKDCTEFILHAFGADHREEVRPVADFYVQKLRGQAHKGEPLAEIFYKKIIAARLLSTAEGRRCWLAAERHNRGLRFVQAPSVMWSKKSKK